MRRVVLLFTAVLGTVLLFSCGNNSTKETDAKLNAKKIFQKEDGTISLDLAKADCYNDEVDPSGNTAEWNVVVSKSGRYNVWISSSTRDTTDLKYKNNVLISLQDLRLEKHPNCDRIIHNSSDVVYPYFRADSFLGSMYIQDTGIYNIQVISEKILPKDYHPTNMTEADLSKLISVSFTPITH